MSAWKPPRLLADTNSIEAKRDYDATDVFHLFCVKCGQRLSGAKTRADNLPTRHELYCDQCETVVDEWRIVAAIPSQWDGLCGGGEGRLEFLSAMATSTFQTHLQHGRFWRDETHSLDAEGFINARLETAEWLGVQWEPRCPICRSEVQSPDFHHWDYNDDIGLCVCRGCHEGIHRHNTVKTQKKLAKTLGVDDWQELAVRNTAELERPADAQKVHFRNWVHRMNIPFSNNVVEKWVRPVFERHDIEVIK